MAKIQQKKQDMIEMYVKKINDSDALIILKPTKLTPNEANALRKKLKDLNSSFNFVKNTLFSLALQKANKKIDNFSFEHENAIVFCKGDASENTKIVYDFIQELKKGEIQAGLLGNKTLNGEDIERLAKLPSKEIMIGITVRTIAAPLTGFINVLNGTILNFLYVLKNISEQKQS
jgi:large subunit ribosomal protein L10